MFLLWNRFQVVLTKSWSNRSEAWKELFGIVIGDKHSAVFRGKTKNHITSTV